MPLQLVIYNGYYLVHKQCAMHCNDFVTVTQYFVICYSNDHVTVGVHYSNNYITQMATIMISY